LIYSGANATTIDSFNVDPFQKEPFVTITPEITTPAFILPDGSCDCHMHVFGNAAQYPLSEFRSYTVEEAPLSAYQERQQRTGLQRNVLVQASGYHTDNRCMVDALISLGDSARGVAVVDAAIATDELRRLDAAGVRGVRINLVSVGASSAQQIWDETQALAVRLAELGWHMQFFATPTQLVELQPLLRQLPVPAIIDHMGLPVAAAGVNQPGFAALRSMLADGRCWVKLSGADRITRGAADMSGAGVFARALIEANPDQLVWGSDWPHIGWHSSDVHASDAILPFRQLDEGALLGLLDQWTPNMAVLKQILVDNPARFYGF
jgi:2-pyrone-4,6-dicarboxylate lactonase